MLFFLFIKGVDIANHPEDSSSMMHIESDMIDSNLGR
jgi:hypothetical protein